MIKKSSYATLTTDELRNEAIMLVGYAKVKERDYKIEQRCIEEDMTGDVEPLKRAMYLYYIADYFGESL